MSVRKILILGQGIEDNGMRGLGKVIFALIDGLAANGYQPYLLTGAPLQKPTRRGEVAHNAVVRRSIDHYLCEGWRSTVFAPTRANLARRVVRDLARLFVLGRVDMIPQDHQVPTQHLPAALQHFANLTGFINVSLVYKLANRVPLRLRAAIVYAIARHSGIDTIVTASPYPLPKPRLFRRKVRVVQYIHDVMPLNILETVPGSAARFAKELTAAIKGADTVMVLSLSTRDKLGAIAPGMQSRLMYLPCVPTPVGKMAGEISLLAKHNLNRGHYILFMSTLETRKNLSRLIQAFELIAKRTDFKLVLVGSPGYGWHEIQQTLEALKPAVRARIILPGYISERDKWFLIYNCGLVVQPSIDEGFGIPAIEGLIAKKPVVSTRLNSVEEFAPAGCVVYVDNPYDTYELAEKLLTCINNRGKMREPLQKGSAIIAEMFSEQAFAQRLASVLEPLPAGIVPEDGTLTSEASQAA